MTEAAGSSSGVKIGWTFPAEVPPLSGPDECRADHWSWSSLWSNCLGKQICCKSAWWSSGGVPELHSVSLPACLSAAFLSPLALYYSPLLTDEEFSLLRRDVPEPCSSFRRRIRASADLRRLQINKSTGFENSSFQLLRSPWGSRDAEPSGKVGQTADAMVSSVFDPHVEKGAAVCLPLVCSATATTAAVQTQHFQVRLQASKDTLN